MIRNILRKSDGAFANVIVVKGDIQMKIPDNISDVDAATQGIALITMVSCRYKVQDNDHLLKSCRALAYTAP
jgi:NADPH:quinone reductase-like Zn-dependent oxidoreductase